MRFATCHSDRQHFAKGKCKSCYNAGVQRKTPAKKKAWNDRWREAHPARFANNLLKYKYGISYREYVMMQVAQGNVCAICRNPEKRLARGGKVQRLSVDHDHKTGVVRGLLCAGCNSAIHKADLNIEWLESAARYLTARQL